MENNLEQKIIQLYLDGIGSTTISKMLSINKKKILTLLKEKKLIRVRHLPKEFYDNFWEINGVWYGHWVCENCNEKILFSVNEKSLLNRNLKNKNIYINTHFLSHNLLFKITISHSFLYLFCSFFFLWQGENLIQYIHLLKRQEYTL